MLVMPGSVTDFIIDGATGVIASTWCDVFALDTNWYGHLKTTGFFSASKCREKLGR